MNNLLKFLKRETCLHKTRVIETEILTMDVLLMRRITRYVERSRCLKCGKEFYDKKFHIGI